MSRPQTITTAQIEASLLRRETTTVQIITDDVCAVLELPRSDSATSRVRALLYQMQAAGDADQVGWADRDGSRQGRSAALWALSRRRRAELGGLQK